MNIAITLHWWMAVPGAITVFWVCAAARTFMRDDLDSDDVVGILFLWFWTAGPAILSGWLA